MSGIGVVDVFAKTFSDERSGCIGEGKDTDGGEVNAEISVGEAEDDRDANGKEEFAK